MTDIVLEKLSKVFADGTNAVTELDLAIGAGEFVVFVGPSGCGKTTALRMVAGLEEPTSGEIHIGGVRVTKVPPKDRDIAMVFQDYALYPQMSVFDNMAFALKLRGEPKADIRARVASAASTLHLTELLGRKPRALSGGQRQRVAMGRAIVREPQAFLLDEPLSNLDAKLRVQMRAEISRIQRELEVTTIYVTHDQTEAMTMGDRVAVMRNGVLQQVAAPEDLYRRPLNVFTAGFIGAPAMNFVEAQLERQVDGLVFRFGEHQLPCTDAMLHSKPGLASRIGGPVIVGIRPQHLQDAAFAPDSLARDRLAVTVELREALGSEVLLSFEVGGRPVDPEALGSGLGPEEVGGQRSGGPRFVARVHADSAAQVGDRIELAVAVDALHAFDASTGVALDGDPQ